LSASKYEATFSRRSEQDDGEESPKAASRSAAGKQLHTLAQGKKKKKKEKKDNKMDKKEEENFSMILHQN
jgi:hypothetical protein